MKKCILILALATVILGFVSCRRTCVCKVSTIENSTNQVIRTETEYYDRKVGKTCNDVIEDLKFSQSTGYLIGALFAVAHGQSAIDPYRTEYECEEE